MRKIRILFVLDHKLMTYRLPFFEQLVMRGYDITIVHPGPIIENVGFLTQRLSNSIEITKGLSYRFYKKKMDASIVVYMQNIRIINLWLITLNPFRKVKIIHWGIGVSSANGLKLKHTAISKIRSFLSRFASAVILYSSYPLPLFPKSVQQKIFIANNTIFNPLMNNYSSELKTSFLFIGSLNKRKGLDDLIIAFSEMLKKIDNKHCYLNIIGEGEERERLEDLSIELEVEKNVIFLGKILYSEEKVPFFKSAIASISPKQAGLSVLESFSFGVPFVSYQNAISGGEHLNIQNGYNGYLVESIQMLTHTLIKLYNDRALSKKLGDNAYKYYENNRQMKYMVNSFDSAIKYSLRK